MDDGQERTFTQFDRRKPAGENDFEYHTVGLLKVHLSCCTGGTFMGTCFFIERKANTVYFLTAAHVIYCAHCDKLAAGLIEVYAKGVQIGFIDSSTGEEHGWYEVCPKYRKIRKPNARRQYDYGILAFHLNEEMIFRTYTYLQKPCFTVPKTWSTWPPQSDKRVNCTVSGFPAEYRRKPNKTLALLRHSDFIEPLGSYLDVQNVRLWRHVIDSSGGQSGSPVFDENGTVLGIHIGFGFDQAKNPIYNLAVVLDESTLEYAMSRFKAGKR